MSPRLAVPAPQQEQEQSGLRAAMAKFHAAAAAKAAPVNETDFEEVRWAEAGAGAGC